MSRRPANLRKLAYRQRWLLWLMLLAIAVLFSPVLFMSFLTPGPVTPIVLVLLPLIQIAATILMAIGIIRVLTAQGTHIAIVIICAILMLAPCGNLLLLLLINTSATRTLRRAGLHVGFMGVKPDEIERVLDPNLCKKCGYNLTGNVSGICPEGDSEVSFTPPMAPG